MPLPVVGSLAGQTAGTHPGGAAPQRIPRWLERFELVLRVILRMYIGLAICYAPWSPMFWDQNPLFLQFPALGVVAANGAVRGIVSGLGLLNLLAAEARQRLQILGDDADEASVGAVEKGRILVSEGCALKRRRRPVAGNYSLGSQTDIEIRCGARVAGGLRQMRQRSARTRGIPSCAGRNRGLCIPASESRPFFTVHCRRSPIFRSSIAGL